MSRKTTWLLFDVNNIAWRAFHATGHLAHEETPTGVLYGMLREIRTCMQKWNTMDCVFCFDEGIPFRAKNNPWYKQTRKNRKFTDEELKKRATCYKQINVFRDSVIERIGLGNILAEDGYEADDMVASVCRNLGPLERAVIISGDQDLYQCLSKKVMVYHPQSKKEVSEEWFRYTYGVDPESWAKVKAIAGCKSDDIPSIGGQVGEKTACAYLAGLTENIPKAKLERIKQSGNIIRRNLTVTTIPYPGTPVVDLTPGLKVDVSEWDVVMHKYGFASMEGEIEFFKARRKFSG